LNGEFKSCEKRLGQKKLEAHASGVGEAHGGNKDPNHTTKKKPQPPHPPKTTPTKNTTRPPNPPPKTTPKTPTTNPTQKTKTTHPQN